eukprot:6182994-Pleurochrysis_carterae.AAC.1
MDQRKRRWHQHVTSTRQTASSSAPKQRTSRQQGVARETKHAFHVCCHCLRAPSLLTLSVSLLRRRRRTSLSTRRRSTRSSRSVSRCPDPAIT